MFRCVSVQVKVGINRVPVISIADPDSEVFSDTASDAGAGQGVVYVENLCWHEFLNIRHREEQSRSDSNTTSMCSVVVPDGPPAAPRRAVLTTNWPRIYPVPERSTCVGNGVSLQRMPGRRQAVTFNAAASHCWLETTNFSQRPCENKENLSFIFPLGINPPRAGL